MKRCKHCNREQPFVLEDDTCRMGGRCEYVGEEITQIDYVSAYPATLTKLGVNQLDAPWLSATDLWGQGQRLTWSFPDKVFVESFEVEPYQGKSYNGFINSLLIGHEEFLRLGPYPISMFSPGMPKVVCFLPHVPVGHHLTLTLDFFAGKIRPTGFILQTLP